MYDYVSYELHLCLYIKFMNRLKVVQNNISRMSYSVMSLLKYYFRGG